jgi:hypothetical protein
MISVVSDVYRGKHALVETLISQVQAVYLGDEGLGE